MCRIFLNTKVSLVFFLYPKASCTAKVCILNIILAVHCAVVPQGAVSEAYAPIRGVNRLDAKISLEELLIVKRDNLKAGLSHFQDGVIFFGARFAVIVFSPASVVFPVGGG